VPVPTGLPLRQDVDKVHDGAVGAPSDPVAQPLVAQEGHGVRLGAVRVQQVQGAVTRALVLARGPRDRSTPRVAGGVVEAQFGLATCHCEQWGYFAVGAEHGPP